MSPILQQRKGVMNQVSKRIVLTGASRGLGRALVEQFVSLGHTVYACSRSKEVMESLSRQYGTPHLFHDVDVADWNSVQAWAHEILEIAAPDLVINNAALINRNANLWETDVAEFSQLVDVNIKGVFHVIRAFAPAMVARQQGVFVNLSSGWGRSTSPQVAPYCATKWGVEGMTRAMADELPYGMAAIPLNPGVIHTEMLESCFGESASAYPNADRWAVTAAPFLLELDTNDNGDPLTAPSG